MKNVALCLLGISLLFSAPQKTMAFDLNDLGKLVTTGLGAGAGYKICSDERGVVSAVCTAVGGLLGYAVGDAIFRDDPQGVRAHNVAFQRCMDRSPRCDWYGGRGVSGKFSVGRPVYLVNRPDRECQAFRSFVYRGRELINSGRTRGYACLINGQWTPLPEDRYHLVREFQQPVAPYGNPGPDYRTPAPYGNPGPGYGTPAPYGNPGPGYRTPSPYGRD